MKTKKYVQSKYHQKCMELADMKLTIKHMYTTIISTLDAHKAANIEHNCSLLNQ